MSSADMEQPLKGNGTGGWRQLLPSWGYMEEVGKVAKELEEYQIQDGIEADEDAEALPLQCVTGPAVKIALWELMSMWTFALVLPWPVLFVVDDHADEPEAYATYPWQLWFVLLLFVGAFLLGEWKCLKYAVIPQVQVVHRFNILGIDMSFKLWLAVTIVLSGLCHMDLITNGLFLAVTNRTHAGHVHSEWQHMWNQTVTQSMLNPIGPAHRYDNCVLVVWLLMFLQPLQALVHALPVKKFKDFCGTRFACIYNLGQRCMNWEEPDDVNYEFQDSDYAFNFTQGDVGPTYYQTLTDTGKMMYSGHGLVLITLAEVNRMTSLTMMQDSYVRQKVKYYLKENRGGPMFGLVRGHLRLGCQRIWLYGVLESALITNLQGTLLAMNLNMKSGDIPPQLTLTLAMSGIVGFKRMWEAFWRMQILYDMVFTNQEAQQVLTEDFKVKLRWQLAGFAVSLWIYFGLMEYVVFKTVALGVCPDRMWNLQGCADLGHPADPQLNRTMEVLYLIIWFIPVIAFFIPYFCHRCCTRSTGGGSGGGDSGGGGGGAGDGSPVNDDFSDNNASQDNAHSPIDDSPETVDFTLLCEKGNYKVEPEGGGLQNGEYYFTKENGEIWTAAGRCCGKFSMQSMPSPFKIPDAGGDKPMRCISICDSEIMLEIQKSSNENAFFVLPSQLNGAEYQSFESDWIVRSIDEYQDDNTGGPRGQLAVHPAAGQFVIDNAASDYHPKGINAVRDVIHEVKKANYDFQLQNGYLKIPKPSTQTSANDMAQAWKEALKSFKMLVMQDALACGLTPSKRGFSQAKHKVNLIYASAVPVDTYNNIGGDIDLQLKVAEATLVAQYYGALSIAAQQGTSRSPTVVYLMPLGGGVFQNPPEIIVKGISLAVEMLSEEERRCVNARVLTFHRKPSEAEEFTRLLDGCQKLRT